MDQPKRKHTFLGQQAVQHQMQPRKKKYIYSVHALKRSIV